MDASIIIVSWNVREHLRRCLHSIQQHTQGLNYEVIVVDNASQDGSVEMVEQEFPKVNVIASNTNIGFGAANNRGAEIAAGDVLVFLNDDIVLTSNAVQSMVGQVNADTSIGVLGCHLVFPDGSHQDSVRRFPTLSSQVLILTKMHNLLPGLGPLKRYYAKDTDYTTRSPVDQVMGACMVIPRNVFEQAGGFDEQFFIWFEEVDLQKRVTEAGRRVIYTPEPEVIHVKGPSFAQNLSLRNQLHFNANLLRYARKHMGLVSTVLLACCAPFSLLLAALVQLLKKTQTVNQMKYEQG